MTQALDIKTVSCRTALRPSWRGRVRAWLLGRARRDRVIPFDQRSAHLLRDIGLAEDVRANELLRDQTFIRR